MGVAIGEYDRRSFYVLTFAVFTGFVGFTTVVPLLPLYVLRLGVNSLEDAALWSGLIIGITPFISATASPFWGAVADRYGYKPVIQRSLFGFTILFIPMLFATSAWQLFVIRALTGLISGFGPQSTALATRLVPQRQLASAVGTIQFAQVLGMAVGPLIGGLVGDRYGFHGAVLAAASLNGFAAIVVTIFLRSTKPASLRIGESRPPLRSVFALAGFVPMLVVLASVRFIERAFDPLMPLLIVKLDPGTASPAALAGLIIGLGTLATAASAALAGRLGDRFQGGRLLQATLLAGAMLSPPFFFSTANWQVLVLRVALGLFAGGALTLALAFAAQNLPAGRFGAAFGILISAGQYGNGVGAMVSGAMASLQLELPFLVCSGLYLVAAMAAGIAIRQRREGGAPRVARGAT